MLMKQNIPSIKNVIGFHDTLNPVLWDGDNLKLPVQVKLLKIAHEFFEFCGIDHLDLLDITMTGSNAGYAYTLHSDIDLHLIVNFPEEGELKELFSAKSHLWNHTHDIKILGYDVEVYVQRSGQPHVSSGVYSLLHDSWVSEPKKVAVSTSDAAVQQKFLKIKNEIKLAIADGDIESMDKMTKKLKKFRISGLDQHGEWGVENLTYKLLKYSGLLEKLRDAIDEEQDRELSIYEAAGSLDRFINQGRLLTESEKQDYQALSKTFVEYVARGLNLKKLPKIEFITEPRVDSVQPSFGSFNPNDNSIVVSCLNRHPMDVFRTLAHELIHYSQNMKNQLHNESGATGSFQENEANAGAGIIMRMFGKAYPGYFN